MGCSNTTNNKKSKSIKGNAKNINVIKNKEEQIKVSDSAGTNDGFTYKKEIEIEEESDNNKGAPQGCVEIKVDADTTEQMFPVWIEKGVKTKIHVKGRWSLFPESGAVSYRGHSNFNYKHREANIGALIGRVLGGNYFPVVNGMTFVSEVSGPIYLFANNSRFSVQPTGFLNVFFENAKFYSIEEIELMCGWNLNILDTTKGHDYLSTEEKQQIIILNKIKTNAKLFAQQYLINFVDLGESYKEIYQKLLHYPPGKLLKPSKALYLAARDHAKDIGENGTTGHGSTDGSDLRTRISRYSSNPNYFGENCSYNLKDSLSIVIQMVVDDGFQTRAHRANILNEIYTQVGISIQPHSSYKYTCVQVFGSNIVESDNIKEYLK